MIDSSNSSDPIRHVVVLMLENHSFDQMLGCFKSLYPDIDGVDPAHPHSNSDDSGKAYFQAPTTERQMLLDPHHEVPHVAEQISDHNGGFVRDFARSFPQSTPQDRQFIMGYYPRGFLPALHDLAANFTICDRWHASVPGPTWTNRFFAFSGTSMGKVDMPGDGSHKLDIAGYFAQTQDTIFDRMNEQGIHWKVYFHDIPQTSVFAHQRLPHNAARYFYIDNFFADARGTESEFPAFSLIEPRYMGWGQNDDHPPHDIMRAEKLIADVYTALRGNAELWQSTLLVVVYDEHGGFYDHVEPPPAVPPDEHHQDYAFDRLGVRVPAILVSPWTERRVDHTPYDHTSLLKYLIDKWNLAPLGQRTATANSIKRAISAVEPRTDTIERIALNSDQLTPPDPNAEEKAFDVPNPHQTSLQILADYLKNEIVIEGPKFYAGIARLIESIKSMLDRLLYRVMPEVSAVRVSLAEPDKLAHHTDATPKDNVVHYLMRRKRQAVRHLAKLMRDHSLSEAERQHALHTLSLISGRKYHRETDGMKSADEWLKRHRS